MTRPMRCPMTVPVAGQPGACGDAAPVDPSPEPGLSAHIRRHRQFLRLPPSSGVFGICGKDDERLTVLEPGLGGPPLTSVGSRRL
jgi:hypothetical protein